MAEVQTTKDHSSYKNRTIQPHNQQKITLKGFEVPIKANSFIKFNRIFYIQTEKNEIYSTKNMIKFDKIIEGHIVGVTNKILIINGCLLSLISDKFKINVSFYENLDKILYKSFRCDGLEGQFNDNFEISRLLNFDSSQLPVSRPSDHPSFKIYSYKHYVVVYKIFNLLFMTLNGEKDVHFTFKTAIDKIENFRINGINLLKISTKTKFYIYYYEHLITIVDNGDFKLFNNNLEKKLFEFLDMPGRLELLRDGCINQERLKKCFNLLLHKSNSISSFKIKYYSEKYKQLFSDLDDLDKTKYFNEGNLFSKHNHKIIYENLNNNYEISDIIAGKYYRLFKFIPELKKSKNLAYKIIKYERKYQIKPIAKTKIKVYDLIMKKDPMNTLNCCDFKSGRCNVNQILEKLLKIFKLIFKDSRVSETINILLESMVLIEPDINDLESSRKQMFILRAYSCSGLILISNISLCISNENNIYLNNSILDDKIDDDLLFLRGSCLQNFVKKHEHSSILTNPNSFELGKIFGYFFIHGLDDDNLKRAINQLIMRPNDEFVKYLLLILSTRGDSKIPSSGESQKKDFNNSVLCNLPEINSIFIDYLNKKNINFKFAALASMAIYNLNSNDNFIFSHIIQEANNFGPIDPEKCVSFYSREYRTFSTVCASLIYKGKHYIYLKDSFSELILNGFSFIGLGSYASKFYRCDLNRPDEIFYAELFQLLSNFKIEPNEIIETMNIENKSKAYLYRCAAKVFYLPLFLIKKNLLNNMISEDYIKIYRFLENIIEQTENKIHISDEMLLIFNYALLSLSLIKHGSFDINLLRILRRQVLKTKDLKNIIKNTFFDKAKKDVGHYYTPGFDSMNLYKVCIGLLCCGFGFKRISSDDPITIIKIIIAAFFFKNNEKLEFSYFDLFKMLLFRCLETNKAFIEMFIEKEKAFIKSKLCKEITNKLFKEFSEISNLDRKFVLDVLSDYYENHHFSFSKKTFLNLKFLAELINSSK